MASTAAGAGKRGRNEGVSSLDSENKKAKGKQLSDDEEEANVMNLKSMSSINGLEIRLSPHALRSAHPRLVHPSPAVSVTSLISPSSKMNSVPPAHTQTARILPCAHTSPEKP
jgi:hypothetical protein